jgi:VWFA-related protein
MDLHRTLAPGVVGLLLSLAPAHAQNPERSDTVIRSSVHEVLLDVVVRHKNLSLVKKLKASDFTVTEDGVPQTIKTFRFVGGREAQVIPETPAIVGPAVRSAAPHANSLREPNFVSIVFDEIGPDSRKNALAAAADFISQEFQDNTYAAIFGLNLRLNALQGFTNDRAVLQAAVQKAVSGNSMELASASAGVLNQTTYSITGSSTGITLTPGIDPSQSPDLATSSSAQSPLSESQQYMAQLIGAQRNMVSYQTGMRVLTALLRLVQFESRLPGRKTVLYLSEGLVKPPDRGDFMRTVIGAANRGNVSFYCIDVRGLTSATSNGTSRGLTQTAGAISKTQSVMSDSPSAGMRQASEFDVIQDALSAETQLNMADLAESTGGFAVFNTNDFKRNMARIMEDVRTHFEISYVPASTIYDGHFRQVKVTVNDPKLVVQTRDGYFAMPDLGGASVLPFELAGLRALSGGARHDFDFHASALRFRPWRDGYRYEMAFDLEIAGLNPTADKTSHKARIHATFLALIKDASGQIVNKVSQEIDREVPEDKLDQFRRGRIIFTSPFEAVSGRYTIEAAVVDPEGAHASTKRLALVVPKPGEPALSNISLVHKLDPLDSPRDPGNPFEFDGGKVLPEIAQAANDQAATALFFVVYPEVSGGKPVAEKPSVTIVMFRDGKEISRTTPDVGAPDEVNSFPIIESAKLPPGDYVARVTVEQGGRASREVTAFRVNR